MQKLDLEKLKELKEELDYLENDDVLYLEEDGEEKYVVLPVELYDVLESYRSIFEDGKPTNGSDVKIISTHNPNELSYDEYETIKKQLMDIFDKTFRPKPDKLN